MTVRASAVLILIAFAGAFAYQIGGRLSTEALDMAMGLACGMTACVPAIFGLIVALTRSRDHSGDMGDEDSSTEERPLSAPSPRPPQVIVISPPNGFYGPGNSFPLPTSLSYPGAWASTDSDVVEGRDWKIVGEEGE